MEIIAVKLLWRGAECWKECLMLLSIAEMAALSKESNSELGGSGQCFDSFIVRRRFLLLVLFFFLGGGVCGEEEICFVVSLVLIGVLPTAEAF